MRAFFSRHSLLLFFLLAFALSWYPWVIALLRGGTSGPNPLGPLVAGAIVSAIAYGWQGERQFLGRIIRARVAAEWYAAALIVPVVICLAAIGITLAVFGHSIASAVPSPDKLREVPDRFLFTLLFVGLGEEPGWRGFAIPHLQIRRSPIVASLILAPIWAIWHLPLIGNEFPLPIVAPFLLSVFGATFFLTWLFNSSNGSALLTTLSHATVNTVGAGLLFPQFSGSSLIALWWIYGFVWLVAGLLILRFLPADQRVTAST